MTIAGEPLRPQGFQRTLYTLIHSRITSQGWHNLALTQCRANTPGTHARKDEDGLLLEFPCNHTRTRSV
jgi:hypothetical protein